MTRSRLAADTSARRSVSDGSTRPRFPPRDRLAWTSASIGKLLLRQPRPLPRNAHDVSRLHSMDCSQTVTALMTLWLRRDAERSGGKSCGRSGVSTWNIDIGSGRPRKRQAPRSASVTPSGSSPATRRSHGRGQHDLGAVRGEADAGRGVHREPHVARVAELRAASVQADSEPHVPSPGQSRSRIARWIASAPSTAPGGCSNTANTSSPRADTSCPPAPRTALRTSRRMSDQQCGVAVLEPGEQLGRALDVGQQEGDVVRWGASAGAGAAR